MVITAAMIDDFDSEKDVEDMLHVFVDERPRYRVAFGRLFGHAEDPNSGLNASFPFSSLGKVMSGLLSYILSCYSIGSAVRNRRWGRARG